MERFSGVLLDIWREACRHIEMEESVPTLTGILSRWLPVDAVEVDGFDWERRLVQTRGRAGKENGRSRTPAVRQMSHAEAEVLRGWWEERRVALCHPGERMHPALAFLLGEGRRRTWLVAPLSSEHGVAGALLMRLEEDAELDGRHTQLVERLGEPFSVALENDRRLRELKSLQEASDAERRSALARLGREELVETIIGRNAGLKMVMQRVALVAGSDVPVLILGETGSGKEVIARAIHEQSGRSGSPFIRVNCGAIPPELIDSELFGHERGAFTGAVNNRRGWFERADGGTLLLDEIGELPLAAQVRLLRVLQEGAFERVGGERPIRVDVRIVAATHRDLPMMVREGRFREDLWYRIAGFPLLLPPLRDRREDIPALARHFVDRASRRFGLRPITLTEEDLDLLCSYSWPGNIRELASVIDRAAILGGGERLELAKALGSTLVDDAPAVEAQPRPAAGRIEPLDVAIRRHIEAALRAAHGRVEGRNGVAAMLGVNPHTLRSRMRKLGIDWAAFRRASYDGRPRQDAEV